MMIFSFLIASVSAGPTSTTGIGQSPSPSPTSSPIINRCGVDGVVPHSYMVTLSSSLSSDRRSTPTSIASFGTNKDKLSVIKGWVQQYINPEDTSNGTTHRKLEANSNSTHVVHYFTQARRFAVAVEAGDDVRHAHSTHPCIRPSASRLCSRPHTPPHQVAMRMAKDPAVSSVECDCYIRADMSLPESDGSSPGTHDQVKAVGMYQVEAVARRLSVHEGAPWGLDRIDTNGRPTDKNYDDGDLTGKGVRVYIVDTGVQGSHDDFIHKSFHRVVNGHTVRAAPQSPPTYAHRPPRAIVPRAPALLHTT